MLRDKIVIAQQDLMAGLDKSTALVNAFHDEVLVRSDRAGAMLSNETFGHV